MFKLDTFRLIRSTLKRFISLTLIVMIGSAFMMGLMSSAQIMRQSVDVYDDGNRLQDLQIYSQYGFCFEDYLTLKKIENVDQIFPSRMMDFYCHDPQGEESVARISEVTRTVNQYELIEGRMPEKDDECLILDNPDMRTMFSLDEKVSFYGDDIDDYLSNKEYVVVGKVLSPEYLSKLMGTSNLHNQELDYVFFVPNVNFISDYYTTIYLTLKGSDKYLSYTGSYADYIDENSEEVEDIAFEQQNYLKNKIKDEMAEKIAEARTEFEEEKQKGQEELDDAARQLDDANVQIIAYETELKSLQVVINKLKNTVEDPSELIAAGSENIDLDIDLDEYDIDVEEIYTQVVQEYARQALEEAQTNFNRLWYQINSAKKQYEEGLKEYAEAVLTYNDEIAKAEVELRKAEQDLEELPKARWTILDRDQHYSSYLFKNNCSQMQAIGYALPFIFFLVAALVCLTTMKRLIDEQRGQIGIFVALGFNKIQIIGKYVSYALLASLIGCLIGIISGQLIFPTVIYNTWRLMYSFPDIKLTYPLSYVFLTLGLFCLLMSSVTAYVVYQNLKEVPASLMRPKAPANAKEIILEKIALIWDKLSFTSKITARNLFRYKARFFMTVIGVAGCTGLLVIGWGIKDSISDIVSIQFGNIFNYDYQIYLENSHHTDENIEKLREDFDNEEVVRYMDYTTKVYLDNDDDTAEMIVIDPRDAYIIFQLRATDKKTPLRLNNDGAIISEKFSKNNDIKKGDYIILESENGIKSEVRVAEICEMYFQHYIFMSSAVYENTFEETADYKVIAVKTSDPEKLVKEAAQLQDYVSIVDFSSMISQFETMIKALDLIIAVVIVTAGSLAFVVLMNITQVNISERIREIATLKVLGFNNREIDLYIFKEILLLTLIGSIIGFPLGVIEHHFVMNVINMEMMMFGMNISIPSFTYAFVLTFVFTGIVLFFMRKPLSEVSMVESLKSVE